MSKKAERKKIKGRSQLVVEGEQKFIGFNLLYAYSLFNVA